MRFQFHDMLALAIGVTLVAVSWPRPASASTIHVARDGSGDYTVLFDGVAAAASGDTILIAAGEYPETPPYTFPGGVYQVSAAVAVPDLTIIGTSPDSVVVGPASPSPADQYSPSGISVTGAGSLHVRGVTLTNLASGLDAEGTSVSATGCRFLNCYNGIFTSVSGSAAVDSCAFIGCTSRGVLVSPVEGGTSATVLNSDFQNCVYGLTLQVQSSQVQSCSFDGGAVGLQLSFGAHAVATDCRFRNQSAVGYEINQGCHGELYDNLFEANMRWNIMLDGLLTGNWNVLMGGTEATIWTTYSAGAVFQGNHILNAGGASIRAEYGFDPINRQDFSLNWWGTTDETQISEWIIDRADDPEHNWIVVDFTPISITRVPLRKSSVGSLKAQFGGPR